MQLALRIGPVFEAITVSLDELTIVETPVAPEAAAEAVAEPAADPVAEPSEEAEAEAPSSEEE